MIDYVQESESYFYCDTGNGTAPGAPGQGIHYIVDPTGWGIQLVFNFTNEAAFKLCPEPTPTPISDDMSLDGTSPPGWCFW